MVTTTCRQSPGCVYLGLEDYSNFLENYASGSDCSSVAKVRLHPPMPNRFERC
jgi:hypothetical protein